MADPVGSSTDFVRSVVIRVFNLNQLTEFLRSVYIRGPWQCSMKINELNVLVGYKYYTFNWGVFAVFVKLRAYIDKVTSQRSLGCDVVFQIYTPSDVYQSDCNPRRGGQNSTYSTIKLDPLFSLRHSS